MKELTSKKRQPAVFRHFSRKKYALFSCFHREIKIGILSVATLGAATSARASLPTLSLSSDTIAEQNLDEAVVTASRAGISSDKAARAVTVITRSEIKASGATTVNDILKLVSGIDVRQRGAYGIQTDISINGGTFDQLTILLNGVSINDPQTGHLAADLPVSADDIERIEILRGAAGRLYGSQAFSGAINIVTRSAVKSSTEFSAAAGSYGTVALGAGLSIKANSSSHRFSGNFSRSDGGTANSDFSKGALFYIGKYRTGGLSAFWQTGFSAREYGANTFYSAAFPDQWESNKRIMASAGLQTEGRIQLRPMVSWIRSTDHFELMKRIHRNENFHRNDVFSVGLNAVTSWVLGRTAAGAEIRSENILSSNLGRPLDSARYVRIHGRSGNYYTHSDSRTDINYFIEHCVVIGPLSVSAGLLANRNTAVNERFRLYPGIDISWRPVADLRLFASWNKAMRLPTFTDLYYKSPTQEGNAGLRPEKVSTIAAGAQWKPRAFEFSVDASYARGSDMIDWVMYYPDDIYHTANFRLDNLSLSARAVALFRTLIGEKCPLERLSLDYTYIYESKDDTKDVYRSNYALEYLRHKFAASLTFRILPHLNASTSLLWQKRMGFYIKYADAKSTGKAVKYSPYALLNAKLSWEMPRYELYLTADNLTAHRYYDFGNVPGPRLWVMAGAKLKIGL